MSGRISSSTDAQIAAAFQDVLGRQATLQDLACWEQVLAQGETPDQVRSALAHSADAQAQINAVDQQVLGRPADAASLSAAEDALAGGASLTQLRAMAAHSAEAAAGLGGLYGQVLGRAADAPGLTHWQDALAAGETLAEVRDSLAHSAEAAGKVTTFYDDTLGLGPTATDLANCEAALATGQSLAAQQAALRPSFAQSATAQNTIQSLYQQVLGPGASASAGDLANWQAALGAGQTTGDLRAWLAHSDVAAAQIQGFYQQALGRDASAGELASWQSALAAGQPGSASLAEVRTAIAGSGEAQTALSGLFQDVLGRAATRTDLAFWTGQLAQGQSLAAVRQAFAHSTDAAAQVQAFYQQLFGTDASATDLANCQAALAAGQSLAQQQAALRPQFATGAYETGRIAGLFAAMAGAGPGPADQAKVAAWEVQIAQGQASFADVRATVAHSDAVTAAVNTAYQGLLGRPASADELAAAQTALAGGQTLAGLTAALRAWLPGGRAMAADEAAGYKLGQSIAPGTTFTVLAGGQTLASGVDAKTLVAELGAYVTLAGGVAPTLQLAGGQALSFQDGRALAGFALAQAVASGQAGVGTVQTYGLTCGWLDQVGQGYLQAAAELRAQAAADTAAGRTQQAQVETTGAALAMQIQAMAPDQRHGLSQQVSLGGGLVAEVSVSGDVADDAHGLAGFSAAVQADPLVTEAEAQVQAAAGASDDLFARAARAAAAGSPTRRPARRGRARCRSTNTPGTTRRCRRSRWTRA